MEFNYKFKGESSVQSSAGAVELSFAPDLLREPTYFSGHLNSKIPFREAISVLHDIVVSDFRFKPKDKSDYKEWAKQQEDIWLAEYLNGSADVEAKLKAVRNELEEVRKQKSEIMSPFYTAQREYFNYIYKHNREAWVVLDPVITVHPDELFFDASVRMSLLTESWAVTTTFLKILRTLSAAPRMLIIRQISTMSFRRCGSIKKHILISTQVVLRFRPAGKKATKK
jgi:hypothetical protein